MYGLILAPWEVKISTLPLLHCSNLFVCHFLNVFDDINIFKINIATINAYPSPYNLYIKIGSSKFISGLCRMIRIYVVNNGL